MYRQVPLSEAIAWESGYRDKSMLEGVAIDLAKLLGRPVSPHEVKASIVKIFAAKDDESRRDRVVGLIVMVDGREFFYIHWDDPVGEGIGCSRVWELHSADGAI